MMKGQLKRMAAIHDLSGLGHSSLAAVMPILSIMGVQVCAMPTAILSSQTDGFTDYSFVDLTDTLPQFIKHWQMLQLDFDCIYSGFLGSEHQIEIVSRFIDDFRRSDTLVVVDPVLGDDGRLYGTMAPTMVAEMRRLVAKADLITPNFTELLYLMDQDYRLDMTDADIKRWMIALAQAGPRMVVVTSVPVAGEPQQTRVLAYERDSDAFTEVRCVYLPVSYPGTGDIFTSVLVGALLQGATLAQALRRGVTFVTKAITVSLPSGYPERDGVLLELVLPELLKHTID